MVRKSSINGDSDLNNGVIKGGIYRGSLWALLSVLQFNKCLKKEEKWVFCSHLSLQRSYEGMFMKHDPL